MDERCFIQILRQYLLSLLDACAQRTTFRNLKVEQRSRVEGREVERRAGGGGGVGRGYAGRRCPCVTAQSCWGEQRSSVSVRSPGFHVRGHTVCEVLAGRRMMTMNGKQHFSMHPALHESKYPGLHSGSEGMRRVCLPAPQVRSGRGTEWL